MSLQVGSLHRSISHPANLQKNIPIIPLFAFPPPESPHIRTSSGMDSDTNSNIKVYHTISQFEILVRGTPDEIENSESSPSVPNPTFQPIYSQTRDDSPSTPSHFSNLTPLTPLSPTNAPTKLPQMTHNYHINNYELTKQFINTPTTITAPSNPNHLSTIIILNMIKPTKFHILFKLHRISSSIFHIQPKFIQYEPRLQSIEREFPKSPISLSTRNSKIIH